jgi:peptide/nickel transport system substrate-binding protein
MSDHHKQVNQLFDELRTGRITRRQFAARASALGLSASAISLGLGLAGGGRTFAQEASPAASPSASPAASPAAGEQLGGSAPGTSSITRAQYEQLIRENYPFEEVGQQGGQVILPEISPLRTLNALLASDATSFTAVLFIFESLLTGSVIDGNPAPALADSWDLADDGLTYTFHLPQNVLWHDGTPFTAADVQFSYDSILDPAVNSSYQQAVRAAVASYEAVDDYTFRIVANDRLVTFLPDAVQTVLIMPRHIWESVPYDEWANDPGSTGEDPSRVVGTGPFRFQSSEDTGNIVTMVRNDDYYVAEATPNIDEYVIQVFPDTPSTIQALQTGEVDVVDTVDFAQVEELRQVEGLEVVTYNTGTFWYYMYNLDPEKTPLFQDVNVRKALFYSVDREALVENLTFGYAVVADGTQPVLSYAYQPDRIETKYRFDPDMSRQLLADAGWADADGDGVVEKDGQKLEIEWISVSGVAEYDTMLASIQQWWADIGVAMTPQAVEFATLLELSDAHDFQIMNLAFTWVPPWDQGPMFRCDAYEGGFNDMKYCNPQYDELDEQQKREQDLQRRIDLLIQQSNIVNEDLPVGIILFRDNRVAFRDRMHNFFPSSFGGSVWSLNYLWLSE